MARRTTLRTRTGRVRPRPARSAGPSAAARSRAPRCLLRLTRSRASSRWRTSRSRRAPGRLASCPPVGQAAHRSAQPGDGLAVRAPLRQQASAGQARQHDGLGRRRRGSGHVVGSYTKEPVEWTSSIYDQAWTYRALTQVAEMNALLGKGPVAERQLARARILRQSVAEHLWQADLGYFRTRILLPPLAPEIDERRHREHRERRRRLRRNHRPDQLKPIFTASERARLAAGSPKPGAFALAAVSPRVLRLSADGPGPVSEWCRLGLVGRHAGQ